MSILPDDFKFIDAHCHFFPPNVFKSVWNFFERPDKDGTATQWPIKYKLDTEE